MGKKVKSLEFVPTQDLGELIRKISMVLEQNDYDTDLEESYGNKYLLEVTKGGLFSMFFGLGEKYQISLSQYNEKAILKISQKWFAYNWLFLIGGWLILIPWITGIYSAININQKMKKVFNKATTQLRVATQKPQFPQFQPPFLR